MCKKMILLISMALMVAVSFGVTIYPNDDFNIKSGSRNNADGLGCKIPYTASETYRYYSYLEFTFGSTTESQVLLNLYNGDSGVTSANWEIEVRADENDVDETTFVESNYYPAPDYYSVMELLGSFELGDPADANVGDGTNLYQQWYQFDITDYYNAHLGETTLFNIAPTEWGSGNGAVFVDKEGNRIGDTSKAPYISTRDCGGATAGLKAWCPSPADGSAGDYANVDLDWLLPSDANESWAFDVYIDTDSGLGVFPITVVGPSITNAEIGGPLTINQQYWWRVDAVIPGGGGVRTGDVWTFTVGVTTPERVAPMPPDDDDLDLNVVLDWDSDTSGLIDHHRLILNNVTDGTNVVVDNIPAGTTNYDLGNAANPTWAIMFYGKDYTWKIEEINASNSVLVSGPFWAFSTVALTCEGLSVEADITGDCEITLADLAEMASGWLECGWTLPGGGSIVYTDKDPCLW